MKKVYWYIIISFLTLLLLLSASKLFIILLLPFILWKVVSTQDNLKLKIISISAALVLILATGFAISSRLMELKNTDLSIAFRESYTYDTPFNGVTIRLLQWRLGTEILEDHNAWLTGVGIGSKQEILNEYYKKYSVYTGNPELGDKGYLDYNFHNQYMESLVSGGVIALLILFTVFFVIFLNKNKHFFPLMVYIITLLFFLTESVLERQAGVMMFSLLAVTFRDHYSVNPNHE
jgi:O-antigen ligase